MTYYGACGQEDCNCLPLSDESGLRMRGYWVFSVQYTRLYPARNEAHARAQHMEKFPRARILRVKRQRPLPIGRVNGDNEYTPRYTRDEHRLDREEMIRSYHIRETPRLAFTRTPSPTVIVNGQNAFSGNGYTITWNEAP